MARREATVARRAEAMAARRAAAMAARRAAAMAARRAAAMATASAPAAASARHCRCRIAVTRTSDGASLGSALTGSTSGLVRIKAGRGTAPVLLTLTGTDVGAYFDEGRSAMVPYGPDQPPLHSLVTAFDEHLGVTALTEAAYRYAVNQFIADPNAIRDGSAPLRRSATADEIARLTPAQIQQAQEAIRAEINRKLPHRYHLVSIATLPTPVDSSSGRGKIKNNRYGIIQAVTGGLALMAGRFDPSLDRPALAVTQQLADDLTDGVIDGVRLDGGSVFARSSAAYDPVTFAATWRPPPMRCSTCSVTRCRCRSSPRNRCRSRFWRAPVRR